MQVTPAASATSSIGLVAAASSQHADDSSSSPRIAERSDEERKPAPERATSLPAAPAPPVSQAAALAASRFVALQRQLSPYTAQEVNTPSTYDLVVPPRARVLLSRLKAAGRDAVSLRLGEVVDAMGPHATDEALGLAVDQAFAAAGALPPDTPQEFGALWPMEVRRLLGHPHRFGTILTVGLSCGSDSSLAIFEKTTSGMRLVLTAESNGYASITRGQLALVYDVSPPDDAGGYFVVTAHGRPWCTSNWRGMHYQVLAPGKGRHPPRARRLFGAYASARHDLGVPGFIETSQTDFTIRFYSWNRLDDAVTRTHVRHYERRGTSFVRVPPFAEHPRDVADEWLSLPWPQASRLTHPSARTRLAPVHARLVAAQDGEYAPRSVALERSLGTGRLAVRFSCPTCSKLPQQLHFELAPDGDGHVVTDVR